jgi:hypothetical protein
VMVIRPFVLRPTIWPWSLMLIALTLHSSLSQGRVPREVVIPFCHTNAPIASQLVPTTWPRSFIAAC